MFWKYLQNDHFWVIPSRTYLDSYVTHTHSLQTVGLCESWFKLAASAIHLRSSSSPLHSCCLALWEENEGRVYAGWGRPLLRAANRTGCDWTPEEDGDNRKCDYGCRDLEGERYGCGCHSDRQRHTHSSHEKVWQRHEGLSEDNVKAFGLNLCQLSFGYNFLSTFMHLRPFCFPSTSRGKPCRAGRSCFDCLCSKLSSLSSHGFIHKIKFKALSLIRSPPALCLQ